MSNQNINIQNTMIENMISKLSHQIEDDVLNNVMISVDSGTSDASLSSGYYFDPLSTSVLTNGTGYISRSGTQFNWTKPSPDLEIQGDLKIQGVSILETLEKIQDRLAILQPDPAKLEKYEALRKAYEHYKLMEKLLYEHEDGP